MAKRTTELVDDPALLQRIRSIWESTRQQVTRSVNSAHVCANWLIGQQIVEADQAGAERAGYGKRLLATLSSHLTAEYGDGFSVSALQYMRSFYQGYPELIPIQHALRVESVPAETALSEPVPTESTRQESSWKPGQFHPGLSWTHYRALIKVSRRAARDFYEIEAIKNGWSGRQLERQIDSLLYDRLLKSRDKAGMLALAQEGQTVTRPIDVLKDPFVLEFLDLPASHRLVETKVEQALLSQLQAFLLELGTGFAFVGRQVRLTLEGDHFYPDLVFYHVKLKCYVIIDLKTRKLTHGDVGQMLLYVHYYDREVVDTGDNPTLGLILCTEKNDAVVRYILDEQNQQIFAGRYQLHLPTEEELQNELKREWERLEYLEGTR